MPPQDEIKLPQTRIHNSARDGKPYDHETIRSVWEKANRQPGFETFSLDHRGTTINVFEYGRRSAYGWVIDRIVPIVNGGTDDISNLRPIHWKHFEPIADSDDSAKTEPSAPPPSTLAQDPRIQ